MKQNLSSLERRAIERKEYAIYSSLLYPTCLRILSHRGEAEEAMHDALLHYFSFQGVFESEAQKRGWLFRVATSKSIDRLRKKETKLFFEETVLREDDLRYADSDDGKGDDRYGNRDDDRYVDRHDDRYYDRDDDRHDDRYDNRHDDRYDDRHDDRHDDRYVDRHDDRYVDRYDDRYDDDDGHQVARIKQGLAQLAPGYRTILSLSLFEGYDFEEIASILSLHPSSVRSQYTRARRKLRALLSPSL